MDELAICKDDVEIIEKELYSFLTRFEKPAQYYDYLLYHFGFKAVSGNGNGSENPENGTGLRLLGKRLRPLMCLLVYKSIAGGGENVIPLVLSSEIMHNASLIHDDIQDHDEVRWGRPTVWKLAGLEQGINFGDTLQAMAYHLILDLENRGFDASLITRLITASNRVHLTVVEGQYLDLLFEKRLDITESEYFEMISKKTAAPYAGVAECAAILACSGKNPLPVEAYKNFGLKFGMLFQLTDDILGVWGDASKTGKIPADIRSKKKTLPIIYGFSQAAPREKELLVSLYSNGTRIEDARETVLSVLEKTRAKQLCQERAGKFYKETLSALEQTGFSNPHREKLKHMADYCYNRSRV